MLIGPMDPDTVMEVIVVPEAATTGWLKEMEHIVNLFLGLTAKEKSLASLNLSN